MKVIRVRGRDWNWFSSYKFYFYYRNCRVWWRVNVGWRWENWVGNISNRVESWGW